MSRTGKGMGNRAANKRRARHYEIQLRSGRRIKLGGYSQHPRDVHIQDAQRLLKAEAKRKRKAAKRLQDDVRASTDAATDTI